MLYRAWNVNRPDDEQSRALGKALGLGPLLSKVLVGRGHTEPAHTAPLLQDSGTLSDPFLLQDMSIAVEIIQDAIDAERPMVIFGDYDVDGVTATALLYSCLQSLGAIVYYKLANRSDDGYGLSVGIVDDIADRGIDLIITVDNGVSATEAAARALERGVTLVVTDHHLPPDSLPDVAALVDPCREEDSPFRSFSGAGVAFLLACALTGSTPAELLEEYGDLAAIGTVADVMSLTGENRTLVRAGLAQLQHTQRPGLAALIDICGFSGREITAESISFGMAPRLNAAGRMGDATEALRLLLATTPEEAQECAASLAQRNADRQQTEQQIMEAIIAQIDEDTGLQSAPVLVVWGEGWHQGIIGIVANRLVDRYGKPSIVIAVEENGEGRGSGRSVQGFSLHSMIASCKDLLIRFGGHDAAAGLSIDRANIPVFRERVNRWARENCPVVDLPALPVDTPVSLAELQVQHVAELSRLEPYGSGNPAPSFLLEGVTIDAVYPVSDGKHTRLRFQQGTGTLYAVLFGTGPAALAYKVGNSVDVIVSLSIFQSKGGPQVSARITEMRPAGLGNIHVQHCQLYDGFVCGALPGGEGNIRLLPTREDAAVVYKAIRAGLVCHKDLRPLFARCGEDAAGRLLVALAALEELGLVQKDAATGFYATVTVKEKRDLFSSKLLQRLEV